MKDEVESTAEAIANEEKALNEVERSPKYAG